MSVVQGILAGSSARSAQGAGSDSGAKGAKGGSGGKGARGADVEGAGSDTGGRGAATGRRSAVRVLRPARTPAAVVVAVMIALLGWVLTAVVVAVMLGVLPPWRLPSRLLNLTTGDPVVPAAAIGMVVCGAGLVALALVPGRPRLMPLECRDPLLAMGLTRAGLRRTLAASAREVEHVRRAGVHILRRRIEVAVVADADTTGALLREVGAAVGDRLSGLGVRSRQEVVVRLRRRGG
ncbi:DUF6286 domain-containing protein [Microbispora bryophytorum]|uniref:DUF6286 domain-containing protein n=1 Tax=Microbispora bryophytorum subsp. camponoti TaxID=1677852 RepID=A0ABR8L822_9ACTN|nr:DUF6286 domain-containing protein [Microbispora camponoti]MBD3146142.1 hypothetical protein [Microbispora camponoti]